MNLGPVHSSPGKFEKAPFYLGVSQREPKFKIALHFCLRSVTNRRLGLKTHASLCVPACFIWLLTLMKDQSSKYRFSNLSWWLIYIINFVGDNFQRTLGMKHSCWDDLRCAGPCAG